MHTCAPQKTPQRLQRAWRLDSGATKKRLTWSVESRFTRFVPLEDGQHPACIAPTITLWSGVASVGQLQQTEVIWQPEETEWPGFSIRGFFHEDVADCEDSNSDYESRHSPHLWNLSDMLEETQQADHLPPCTFTSSLLCDDVLLSCSVRYYFSAVKFPLCLCWALLIVVEIWPDLSLWGRTHTHTQCHLQSHLFWPTALLLDLFTEAGSGASASPAWPLRWAPAVEAIMTLSAALIKCQQQRAGRCGRCGGKSVAACRFKPLDAH